MKKKIILIIIDGWGITKNIECSAIHKASTPTIDKILKNYPNTILKAFGQYVGLPKNTMGNSEVGHLNIGAGRIVSQSLQKINDYIKNSSNEYFANNNILKKNLIQATKSGRAIHVIGLVSDGGIHSHINHLKALIHTFKLLKLDNIYIHAFTDGRDSNPKSAIDFISEIDEIIDYKNIKLASIMGRFYAMDRDNRLERTKIAYDALTKGKGLKTFNWKNAINTSYKKNTTDEFIKPILIEKYYKKIENEDLVIFFNFRTDRPRQLTSMLTQKPYPKQNTLPLDLNFFSFTNYDKNFKNIKILFSEEPLKNTLGEVLSKNNLSQVRIAETEKYPHITYFFSGGREKPFPYENRILCSSPKVNTYDECPEMRCLEITEYILKEIKKNTDVIIVNFANMDMVGHTGNFLATVTACEYIDLCLKKITKEVLEKDYTLLITSDHGNAEKMIDEDGSPFTAHTKNNVPFIVVSKNKTITLHNGCLSNIAPTVIEFLDLKKPEMMLESLLMKR